MSWKALAGIAALTVGLAIGCTSVQPQPEQEPPQTVDIVVPRHTIAPGDLEEINRMRAEVRLPPRVAEGEPQSSPNSNGSDKRITEMVQRIEALETEVAQLRQRMETAPPPTALSTLGPQWTEQEAILVVKRQFQASAHGCDESNAVDRRDCYLRDPVLGGIAPAFAAQVPARHVGILIGMMAEQALADDTPWSAVFEVEQERWRVESIFEAPGSTLVFYVDETTGLVEDVPFTE